MKIKAIVFVAIAMSASAAVWSQEVCLDADGFVVPCPPTNPPRVNMHFSAGTLPTKIGVPSDVYIIGGGTPIGSSYFEIRANKQPMCNTGNTEGSTPIRHCVVTITAPGTYEFDAVAYDGNFNSPYPITVDITQ